MKTIRPYVGHALPKDREKKCGEVPNLRLRSVTLAPGDKLRQFRRSSGDRSSVNPYSIRLDSFCLQFTTWTKLQGSGT